MEGLEQHYRDTLHKLGALGGMLGLIFEKAQNKIQDPAKLRQHVVELIGKEDWSAMSAEVKATPTRAGGLGQPAGAACPGSGDRRHLRSALEQIEDVLADLQRAPGARVDAE